MCWARLFCRFAGVTVDPVAPDANAMVFAVHRKVATAICPARHRRSRRVRSQHERHEWDEPIGGGPVAIRCRVRRFRCRSGRCGRQPVAERAPLLAAPHAQHSAPLRARFGRSAGTRGDGAAAGAKESRVTTNRARILRSLACSPPALRLVPRVDGTRIIRLASGQQSRIFHWEPS